MAQALPQKLDCKGTKPNNNDNKKNAYLLNIIYDVRISARATATHCPILNTIIIYLFIFVVVVSYVDLISYSPPPWNYVWFSLIRCKGKISIVTKQEHIHHLYTICPVPFC